MQHHMKKQDAAARSRCVEGGRTSAHFSTRGPAGIFKADSRVRFVDGAFVCDMINAEAPRLHFVSSEIIRKRLFSLKSLRRAAHCANGTLFLGASALISKGTSRAVASLSSAFWPSLLSPMFARAINQCGTSEYRNARGIGIGIGTAASESP